MRGRVAILCTLLFCGTYFAGIHYQNNQKSDFVITVTWEGKTKQTPDHVEINLSITETGATSVDAKSQATKTMQELEKLLSGSQIPANQIKTQNLSLQQQRDYISGARVVNGYEADQRLSVNLSGSDVEQQAEDLLGKLPSKVKVDSTNFSVIEKKFGREEARLAAFEDAKKQAEQLAKLAGKKLGKVVAFGEATQNFYPSYPQATNFMAKSVESSPQDAILYAGEEEQITTLTVSFELE